MDALKRDWPTYVQTLLQVLCYIAGDRGWLSPETAMAIMGLLAVGGTNGGHRLKRVVPIAAVALLFGCSHQEKPACAPEALAKIQAAYMAEALNSCQGFTYDDCPALPALREKYGKQRAEWEACQ